MKNVKVALVGAGSMGKEHLKAFSALEGVKIAGIHSRISGRRLYGKRASKSFFCTGGC